MKYEKKANLVYDSNYSILYNRKLQLDRPIIDKQIGRWNSLMTYEVLSEISVDLREKY